VLATEWICQLEVAMGAQWVEWDEYRHFRLILGEECIREEPLPTDTTTVDLKTGPAHRLPEANVSKIVWQLKIAYAV
jgi:hypothetical protein